MTILQLLGLKDDGKGTHAGDADAVRRIVEALERIEPARARFIAAFAYLLGRVAYADREITGDELRLMERVVMDRGALPEDQAVLVVQMARSQNVLFGGVEDFLVARQFEEMTTREEKLALLECLFGVAAADGDVTLVEDNEIVRIATALKIEHANVVRARLAHREYLRVLKRSSS